MDDAKRMANVVWFQTGKNYADHVATHGPDQMEPRNMGSSVLDSPFLEWVTQRPKTLERRPLSLPNKIAQQITYLLITLIFTGVVAWAGYITGA
jgi:hypothetical protein